MSARVRRLLAGISGWLLSLPLLVDGSTFALMAADPATGRTRGCYTAIERFLGLQKPSDWIRTAELSAGVLLFVGIPAALAFATIRRRLAERRQPHAA